MPIVEGLAVNSFALDSASIYFAADRRLLRCPKSGCRLEPDQILEMPERISDLVIGNERLFFVSQASNPTSRYSLRVCLKRGCSEPLPVVDGLGRDGANRIVTLDDEVYWIYVQDIRWTTCKPNSTLCSDSVPLGVRASGFLLTAGNSEIFFTEGGQGTERILKKSPRRSSATGSTTIAAVDARAIFHFGGLVYLLEAGTASYLPFSLKVCATETCYAGSPSTLLDRLDTASSLVVDATGAYWVEGVDSFEGRESGGIRTCPLNDCSVKVRTLTVDRPHPRALAVDDAFVYWIENDPSNAQRTVVRRLAK
jgi:hypothetical protein